MSKKIIRVIAGLIFFLMFFIPSFFYLNEMFRKQWDNANNIVNRRQEYIALPEDSMNTVVLGSSGLYAAVNPTILQNEADIYSYNLSAKFNFIPIRYHQLKDISKERPIKLLITDCSNLHLTKEEIEPTIANKSSSYKYGFNFIDDFSDKKEYINDVKFHFPDVVVTDYWFPFFVHHTNWHKINSKKLEGLSVNNILGFNMLSKTEAIIPEESEDDYNVSPISQEYLEKIVELCKENNTYLFLIQTPRKSYKRSLENELKKVLGTENYVFVDYSDPKRMDEMGIDFEKDFFDTGHLNIYGSEKFSKYLARDIETLFPEIPIKEISQEKEIIWIEAMSEYEEFKEGLKK
jgi:hypothetical protein